MESLSEGPVFFFLQTLTGLFIRTSVVLFGSDGDCCVVLSQLSIGPAPCGCLLLAVGEVDPKRTRTEPVSASAGRPILFIKVLATFMGFAVGRGGA